MKFFFDQWITSLIIIAGAILAAALRKLTIGGTTAGLVIAFFIFSAAGYTGIIIMSTFFVVSVVATNYKSSQKIQSGLAQNKKGTRTAGQVLANAGAPAFAAILFLLNVIPHSLSSLIIAACFSSAIADTVSSEMGNVYGKKYYNILSLKKEQRGLDGVVSIEGLLFGLSSSIFIAVIYGFNYGWNINTLLIIICGTAGNLLDSVLGATLERKNKINNNVVNFLNTAFAGILAAVFAN
jgi:uncharacterized protein (TIGR00297 family)